MIVSQLNTTIKDGGNIRSWKFIEALSPLNELSLIYFNNEKSDLQSPIFKKYFKNVYQLAYPSISQSYFDRLRFLFLGIPWEIQLIFSKENQNRILDIIKENQIDYILIRYLPLSSYFCTQGQLSLYHNKVIVDLDDLQFITNARQIQNSNNGFILKNRLKFNNYLLMKYYLRVIHFKKVFVCSDVDYDFLTKKFNFNNCTIVPNAITVDDYASVSNSCCSNFKNILICGNLSYQPNEDSVLWFVNKIFPIIQKSVNVKLVIAGANPKNTIYELLKFNSQIEVHANVPDMKVYLNKASLVAVPLRSGSGTRIKILEAMASHRPVVSTTIGAEGLGVTHQKHCLIADTINDFANECIMVLQKPYNFNEMINNAFNYVRNNYDSSIVDSKIVSAFAN